MERIETWAAVATIVGAVFAIGAWTDSGINRLDDRIETLRSSVEKGDRELRASITAMDTRLDGLDRRLANVEGRLGTMRGNIVIAPAPEGG